MKTFLLRTFLLIVLLLAVAPVTLIVWYRWDSSLNRGYEFGYYGDFNRVKHALTSTPGVTITREWANPDVSLEEFGFDITTSTGQTVALDFQEADLTRNLSGEPLTHSLTTRIETESSFPR